MPERSIRFGVTDHAGRRAATWKCWTQVGRGKADVYLACRALQGNVKLSLHESGRWHVGFDASRFASMFEKNSEPPTRFAGRWDKPAPLIEGLTLACRVHTPWYAATIPVSSLDGKVTWIQAAPQDQSIEVAIFLSEAGTLVSDWPGRRSMNTNLVGSIEIEGGGHVWAVYHTIPLVEPKLPPTPSPRYFKGAGEQNLFEEGTRAVVWGDCEDGSVAFFEAPVSITKNA
jgi:hypothetical protein